MDAYGLLLNRLLMPAWEGLVRRRPLFERLRWLEEDTQHFTHQELVELQLEQLRALLHDARANVPRYRSLDIDPSSIRTRDDLHRIPLLTRDDVQRDVELLRSERTPIAIHKSTSGTLGKPVTFGYDMGSEVWRQAVRLRHYGWAGYRIGRRTFHFWGPGAKTEGWKKQKIELDHRLRRDVFFDCSVRSPERLEAALDAIRQFDPEVMICFATAGGDLARHLLASGRKLPRRFPVICGAEALTPSDRAAMTLAFGEVFETYGSREVMLMASECTSHQLHVPMENVLLELIVRDGTNTRYAEPGEIGEIVVTDLHNYAQPFIRYVNGDRAMAGRLELCKCGRALDYIRAIEGRTTAVLRNAEGEPVGGLFVHALLAHVGDAFTGFQLVQHKDLSVTFRLTHSASYTEKAERYMLDGLKRYLGGVPVRVEVVDELPVTRAGKRQVIITET